MANHHRRHEFAQIEEYTRRELPRLVRRELELRVQRSYSTIEDQLRSELVDIVRYCQSEIFRSYRQANGSSQSSTPSLDKVDTINPTTPAPESYALAWPAHFDLSTTIASPRILDTPVDPLAGLAESLHLHPGSNSVSDSRYISSNEYIDPGLPFVYHHQSTVNRHELFLPSSFENFGNFTPGLGSVSSFSQGWKDDLNSLESLESVVDPLPPGRENNGHLPRSKYAKDIRRSGV